MQDVERTLTLQLIWIVGATERLCSYGFLQSVPSALSPGTVDTFLELNQKDVLESLFCSDKDIIDGFKMVARAEELERGREEESATSTDKELDQIGRLLVDYKNDPMRFAKLAFERAI